MLRRVFLRRTNRARGLYRRACCGLALTLCLFTARGTDQLLEWRSIDRRMDAAVSGWPLDQLLARLADSTGWQIFIEPELNPNISAKFKDVSEGEGLRLLLGNLNFALLPRPNGPSRLYIYKTSLQEATKLVQAVPPPKKASPARIKNELVVTLKKNSKETIEELAKRLGAKIVGRADGLNSYRLQFESEAAAKLAEEALKKDPDVKAAEGNYMIERPRRSEELSASSPADFNLRPKLNNDGSKIVVAVIDTAVQPLPGEMADFVLPSLRTQPETPLDLTTLTHGTSMAETVLHGLALAHPDGGESPVRILPVDVYGPRPSTTTYDIAAGIFKAVTGGANIINLSLGGADESPLLHSLIQDAHSQGVIFVGAAGNQPSTDPTFPAAYPEVIAVTAGDRKGNVAPYANRGNFIDVVAPGTSVVDFNDEMYLVTGTSAATAYISGAAAAFRASGKSPQETEAALRGKKLN